MKYLIIVLLIGLFSTSCQTMLAKYSTYETVFTNESLSIKVQGADMVYFQNNKTRAYHGSRILAKEFGADLEKAKGWIDKMRSSGNIGMDIKKSIRSGAWGPSVSLSGDIVVICFVDQRYPNLQPQDCISLKDKELPEVITSLNNTGPLVEKINRRIAVSESLN